jgi:hypothetical protein
MQVMQFCIQIMDTITGISPESAFGQGDAAVPGVTLRQRQKSSLVLLADEFDALSRFRMDEGTIIFNLLGTIADDRLIRIGGPFDGEVVKLMHEPFGFEYSLYLDDVERDPNIKKLYTESIIAIAPTLIRMNKFVPEILDYMTLPVRFREKLKQAIKANAEAELRATQAGVQKNGSGSPVSPEERQANVDKLRADTALQMARTSRVTGQEKNDQMKVLLKAIVDTEQLKIEKAKLAGEKAKTALDLFKTATDRGAKPKTEKRAT